MPPRENWGTSSASSYILCRDNPGRRMSAASPRVCSLFGTPPTSWLCCRQRYPALTTTGTPASFRNASSPSSRLSSSTRRPQQRHSNSFREKCGLRFPHLPSSLENNENPILACSKFAREGRSSHEKVRHITCGADTCHFWTPDASNERICVTIQERVCDGRKDQRESR
jgi:hypothetical protein